MLNNTISGKIIINEFGNGFINVDTTSVYINKKNLNKAYNNEHVEVELIDEPDKKGLFGKVINYSLIGKTFIGKLHHKYKNELFIYCLELGKSNLISIQTVTNINSDDWLYIKITEDIDKLVGELLEVVPNDLDSIIEKKFNLTNIVFDIECSNEFNIKYPDDQTIKYTDLTHLNTFTIDPLNSRDCDDAFSILTIDNKIHIYVHISDVTYWLNPSNIHFDDIVKRGTTIYGPTKNWSMIPREYADSICSILPNKITYTITNEFIYEDDKLNYIGWYYSIVNSKHKYDYNYVDKHFDEYEFQLLYNTSLLIKKEINDFIINEDSSSHKMIKYWMIYVNRLMSSELNKLYRNHQSPRQLVLLNEFIKYNNKNIDVNNRSELYNFFINNEYSDKQLGQYILKSLLPKAYYDVCDIGHYGLGIDNYTHWTSPIRRSCDLLNHCLLKGYDIDVSKYIKHMNESEITQDLIDKFIIYYNNYKNINLNDVYDAVIIGVSITGITIYVYLLESKSSIHISKLSKEILVFDNNKLINNKNEYKLFDKLKVVVSKYDSNIIVFDIL